MENRDKEGKKINIEEGKFSEIIGSDTPTIIYWYFCDFDWIEIEVVEDVYDDNYQPQIDIFDKLKSTLKDNIKIMTIDAETTKNEYLANQKGITKFPTIQVYKNGKVFFEHQGFKEFDNLVDIILDCHSNG